MGRREAFRQIDIGDFGNDITRAIDLHPITHTNVFAIANYGTFVVTTCDIIFVVQCRVRDNDATHSDRG